MMRMDASRLAALVLPALLGLLAPTGVGASAGPPPPAPRPAGPVVFGEARVRDVQFAVRCEGAAPPLACTLHATFSLVAVGEVRVEPSHADPTVGASLLVDDAPLGPDGRTVAAGTTARVELAEPFTLSVHDTWRESFWEIAPMLARHPLLGESEAIEHRCDPFLAALVIGTRVTVEGTVHVDASAAGRARVAVDGQTVTGVLDVSTRSPSVDVSLYVPSTVPLLRRGGPLLAVGVRYDLSLPSDQGRVLLRGGYEVGFTEWGFASLSFETDFASIMESVVVEAATPELLLFVPSLSAGVGIVARQLGGRDADAALRCRLGVGFPGIGVTGDLDYWPAVGSWTGTVVLRVSI